MRRVHPIFPYLVAIASSAIALLLSLSLEAAITRATGAFFYIAVAVSTWYGGFRPGIVTIILAALALDYYFIAPTYQFLITSFNDFLRLVLFLTVSLIINLLIVNLQESKHKIEQLSQRFVDESSDRLRVALNAAHMGMWDWDIVTGKITWSPEHERLFDLDPGMFDGRYETFDQRLHPDDRAGLNQAVEQAITTHTPYQHQYRVIWRDGSVHWIEGRGNAFYNAAGQPVRMSGTIMAIDQRKQAEDLLQERESLLRLFAEYAPAGIAMLDREMRYVMASQRWIEEYHLSSVDSVIQRSHYEIFPDLPDRWRQIHQRCLAGAIEKCEDDLWIRADGTPQWISWEVRPWYRAAGNIGGIIIFSVDVTRQKQVEIALQQLNAELEQRVMQRTAELMTSHQRLSQSEEKFRQLAENIQDVFWIMDAVQQQVLYVSPAYETLWGRSREMLYQNSGDWLEAVHPEDRDRVWQTFQQQYPLGPFDQEYRVVQREGAIRWVRDRTFPIRDEAGHLVRLAGIAEDITERQRIEEIKNEFIGIVSHELRTPLTAIQMSLGLLKTGIYANRPEKAQRMIEIALTDTNRLVHLVNDILDLERLESGRVVLEKQVCRAEDLMQQALEGMQAIATRQGVRLCLMPTDALVWAAPDTILQTLTNLLSNAIKFSPPKGTVWLKAEVVSWEAGARHWGRDLEHREGSPTAPPAVPPAVPSDAAARAVLFSVRDQGRGIPADKLESIFGRFQQVDVSDSREKGGTGLGLPICRSIVERNGGKIWAESILGQGSTFLFTLPMPPQSVAESGFEF